MYDVVCHGAISLDISGMLKKPWTHGSQTEAIDYRVSPGGDAALVAATLSGLGLKAAVSGGPIGDDAMGAFLQETLRSEGVDYLSPRLGKTSVACIILDADGERSTVTFHDETRLSEIVPPAEAIKGARCLYADGCYGESAEKAGRIAAAAGVPSVLNLSEESIGFMGLFGTVIAGKDVWESISKDPEDAACRMWLANKGVAVATMGEKGCICCGPGGAILRVRPYPITPLDTAGAGSAFAAGLIYARLSGMGLKESLDFASAAGACKCMYRGSLKRLTKEEIDKCKRIRS